MTDTSNSSTGPMPLLDRMNIVQNMINQTAGTSSPPSSLSQSNTNAVGGLAQEDGAIAPVNVASEVGNAVASEPGATPATTPGEPAQPSGSSGGTAPAPATQGTFGNTPAAPGNAGNPGNSTAKTNQATGQQIAASYGWNQGAEWTALNNVVMRESGWIDQKNKTSSASGIGQNINGYGAGYEQGNIPQQIQWTYNYIKNRYGDPQSAWDHEVKYGWY